MKLPSLPDVSPPSDEHGIPKVDCALDDVPIAQWLRQTPTLLSQSQFPTDIPAFSPLALPRERLNPYGRFNAHVLRCLPTKTPLSIFKLFLSTHLLREFATNTNRYAESKGAGKGRAWKPVTNEDLQKFVALCLYMSVFKCPAMEDYWNVNPSKLVHTITSTMSLTRFEQTKRYLHISNHTEERNDSSFFDKLQPFLRHFCETSMRLWIPGSHVSVDEMMVMFHGRSSETVRMKSKPISCGFKIWAICDAGYIVYVYPHSNKKPWCHFPQYRGILPHTAAVVAALANVLSRKIPNSKSLLPTMYVVFMDNLFSTPKLFRILREKDIAATGTVRSNAKGFPKQLAIRGKKGVKLPWNAIGAALSEGGKVLALTWIDIEPVQMLTTLHNVGEGHTIDRTRKRPRITYTNGAQVRRVFGNEPVKTLPIPNVIDDYNLYMGGVDIADQLRAAYTCHLASRRTWMPLFFWLLDSCASNAYKVFSSSVEGKQRGHKWFMVTLCQELLSDGTTDIAGRRANTNGSSTMANTNRRPVYVTKRVVCEKRMLPEPLSGAHLPIRLPSTERKECFQCRVRARREGVVHKRQRTSFKCRLCDVYLCIEENRNCFIEMHTD